MGASLPVPPQPDNSTQGLIMSPGSDVESAETSPPPTLCRRQHQYPPPPGKKYFADNFKLGMKKFSNLKLQTYLFGDSSDLNFLPSEPSPIPFKRAPDSLPLPAIRSLLNLRTDSVRLVELPARGPGACSLEFEFDSEAECRVCVLFSVPVDHNPAFLSQENSGRPELCSELFSYPSGYRQKFSESSFQFSTDDMSTEFSFSPASPCYPLLIKLEASAPVQGSNRLQRQTHTTILSMEPGASRFKPVVLKQRLTVDSLTFLLQEVYGLSRPGEGEGEGDNLSLSSHATSSSLQLEPGEECIVCLAEAKDTLILPCRHLTTCAQCASALKYQSKKCPVCRTEFQALLRIRPLLKPPRAPAPRSPASSSPPTPAGSFASDGYQYTSLFQAVHGVTPSPRTRPAHLVSAAAPQEQELGISAAPYPATFANPSLSPLAATPSDVTT